MDPDELFTTRTLFWLGSYQAAINEASGNKKIPSTLSAEKDEYLYRSFLALGQYDVILGEIKNSPNTPIGLQAVRLFATYLSDPETTRSTTATKITEWMTDGSISANKTVAMIAASYYIHENELKQAFEVIKNGSNMEQYALLVQLYIRIDRLDLAQKQLKTMKQLDEDSTLTMLASAWINVSLGGDKIMEAQYIYEELIDKYGSSASLLNGLAVTKIHTADFEEAESNLQEALTKAPGDPDSLANLICVSYHLQRSNDVINRYLSQLKTKAPTHTLVQTVATHDASFDRVAATLV